MVTKVAARQVLALDVRQVLGLDDQVFCPSCAIGMQLQPPALVEVLRYQADDVPRNLAPMERALFRALLVRMPEWMYAGELRELLWGGVAAREALTVLAARLRKKLIGTAWSVQGNRGGEPGMHGGKGGYRLKPTGKARKAA